MGENPSRVELTDPTKSPSWPKGVKGCRTCTDLAGLRERRYQARDYSGATDANMSLTRHQEKAHS